MPGLSRQLSNRQDRRDRGNAAAAREGIREGFTWLSSATWVVPTRWGYPAFLNFISMPTSVLPTTSLAAGCLAFSANRLPKLVGLRCDGVMNE